MWAMKSSTDCRNTSPTASNRGRARWLSSIACAASRHPFDSFPTSQLSATLWWIITSEAALRAFPRALISFAVALVLLFTGVLGATAAAPTAPNSPTNLSMAKGGKPVLAGGWINSIHIALQFDATVTTNPVTTQVEVQPAGTPFTGTANYVGKQVSSSGPAVVHVWGLKPNQEYHWQARLIDRSGAASDWVPFSNGRPADFGIDKIPPSRPVISSPTDPRSSNWYNNRVVTLHWTATDS